MRPYGSAQVLERRRRQAIALLQEGNSPVEVARTLGVRRRSVRRWNAAYRREGEAGIAARPTPGRPPKLDRSERAVLEQGLLAGAQAAGFPSDLWTCGRVRQWIERRFGVRYNVGHVGRLLRSMGWSPQRPIRRAYARDEDRIAGWVHEEWPAIKKGRRSAGPGSSS